MDKDIKILGLVFGCLIILFFISGNITGALTLGDLRFWRAKEPTTLRQIKPAEDVKPQQVETTQFKTTPISECSSILTKDQCNTLCGSYFTDVLYDVPIIAGGESTCTDTDGGKNIFEFGTCKDGFGEHKDKCIDGTTVEEWFCTQYLSPDWPSNPNAVPYTRCVQYNAKCKGAKEHWGDGGECVSSPKTKEGKCQLILYPKQTTK